MSERPPTPRACHHPRSPHAHPLTAALAFTPAARPTVLSPAARASNAPVRRPPAPSAHARPGPFPQRMEVRVGIETPERAPAWSTRHLARKGVCGVRLARSHSRAMPAEPGASCAVRTHQRISHNHVSCSAAMRTVVNHAMDIPPPRARAPTSLPPLSLSPPTLRGQVVRRRRSPLVLC